MIFAIEGATAPTEEERGAGMALSAKETALKLGTDARTFRKFMRATLPKDDQPGQGNRYNIEEADLKDLKKKFAGWQNGKAPKPETEEVDDEPRKKKNKKGKKAKQVEAEEIDDEVAEEDLDLDDLEGPDDDDLVEIDDEDLEDL